MLESKLAPFCCAGTSIHCLFCCGKRIFRPLWGKVPRSYRPVSASVYIIVLQLYERTKHDHIDRNVCFLFVKIKCILLVLKLRCKQCIRSTIHPLGLDSYFHFPSFSQDHYISWCGALLEHLPFYCLFITAFAISTHLRFVGYMVFTDWVPLYW